MDAFLKEVVLDNDVFAMCVQHALSTESEEIMGLLIGEVDEINEKSYISGLKILHRYDKQPDRVEIQPEQLAEASTYVEELSRELNKVLRVIGWYHSHPHITVWPSHVDVRTQDMYQTMDKYFVGLIFSVYPQVTGRSTSTSNTIEVTAFQAKVRAGQPAKRDVKITVTGRIQKLHNLEAVSTLPKILLKEENDTEQEFERTCGTKDLMTMMHNEALRIITHNHIIEKVTDPLCESLKHRLELLSRRRQMLEMTKHALTEKSIDDDTAK